MFYGKTSGDGGTGGSGRGNRNERYDQMIKQQQLIEQKKLEIQARLEAERQKKAIEAVGKQKSSSSHAVSSSSAVGSSPTSSSTSAVSQRNPEEENDEDKKPSILQNVFNNDGSFFEQFKQMQNEALKKKKEEEEKAEAKKIKEEPIEYDDYGTPIRNNKPAIKILQQETMERSSTGNNRPFDGGNLTSKNYYNAPPPPPPPPPKINQDVKPYFSGNSIPAFQNIPPPPPPPPQPGVIPKLFGGFPSPAVRALASIVAEQGDHLEEELRMKHKGDPLMWFLFKPDSAEYRTFRSLVAEIQSDCRTHLYNQAPPPPPPKVEQKFKAEFDTSDYVEFGKNEFSPNIKRELSSSDGEESDRERRERKRRSRWGPQSANPPPIGVVAVPPITVQPLLSVLPPQMALVGQPSSGINLMSMPLMDVQPATTPLSKVTRATPQLLAYAKQAYGRTDLDEEEWKQCEEAYKMNLVFQDIAKKKAKDEEVKRAGKFKHEYDSDEEVDGGTWEHRQRMKEMEKTRDWADELTKKAKGKHHIGDFLPPDELSKFMEKYKAVKEGKQLDESEYQEYKIQQDNIGFKMLQKMGWSSGEGLGAEKQGIVAPIDKGNVPSDKQGLGVEKPGDLTEEDDEFTAYRKRMMLAYRFRPNPLNNPRRAYY